MFDQIKDRRAEGDTGLRQCQLAQLYLFDVFADICKRHELRYWLHAGTLLGAMRHDGFIPWDDDLDVAMPVRDCRRFLEIARDELPPSILLQVPERNVMATHKVIKLRDRYSFYCEPTTRADVPSGIFIDIFMMETWPALPLKFIQLLARLRIGSWSHYKAVMRRSRVFVIMKLVDVFIAAGWRILSGFSECAVFAARHLGRPVQFRSRTAIKSRGFPINAVLPLGEKVFEGRLCNVPHDSDAVLWADYGDWRTPPPPEKRKLIHSNVVLPMTAPHVPWAMERPKE